MLTIPPKKKEKQPKKTTVQILYKRNKEEVSMTYRFKTENSTLLQAKQQIKVEK